MYVNRPRSSKGRVRPTVAQMASVDLSLSPRPPANGRRSVRSGSDLSHSSDPEEPVSLNRYRVLPSIQKKNTERSDSLRSTTDTETDHTPMGRSDPLQSGTETDHTPIERSDPLWSGTEMDHTPIERSDPLWSGTETDHTPMERSDPLRSGTDTEHTAPERSDPLRSGTKTDHTSTERSDPLRCGPDHPAGEAEPLLLAIRTGSGQRLRAVFRPAERLQALVSAAEAEFGLTPGRVVIETMDVPRRTFSDLSLTLAQCGLLQRTLLCISTPPHD